MKTQLNEIKRMQQLAGLITEAEAKANDTLSAYTDSSFEIAWKKYKEKYPNAEIIDYRPDHMEGGFIAQIYNPDKGSSLNEEVSPEQAAKAGETPKTSDVNNLTKLISNNTSIMNRLKTVDNNNEVVEFLEYILNTINPKVKGVNRSTLKSIIDNRFT